MRKSMENSKLLAFFYGLPHCLFQEQINLFQEQVTSHFPWSPLLLVPGTSTFVFSMVSLTACSRSKQTCSRNKLLHCFHALPYCLFQEQLEFSMLSPTACSRSKELCCFHALPH